MWKSLKKWWKYMGAKLSSTFNEKADPKVQLEQAITEAQEQHRRLKEQAANVIANQKQTEMRLDRGDGRAREAQPQRPAGRAHGRRGSQAAATRRRPPSSPPRPRRSRNQLIAKEARGRGPQGDVAAVHPGRRAGQGGGAAERPPAPAEALREAEAPLPARPGEDAGADEHGDDLAHRDRSATTSRRSTRSARRSRPATPRRRACPSSRACRSSRRCSRSSRPR